MISKEELFDTLNEMLGGDLSEGAVEYVASGLLQKFVLFERPDAGKVERRGGQIFLDGVMTREFSPSTIEEWATDCEQAIGVEVVKLMQARGLLNFYRETAETAKVTRREELVKEAGADTFEGLPPMLQKLIIRLVDAELASGKN